MNEALFAFAPAELWKHFEALNAVPRPSKREERVIAFMKQFGEDLGFDTKVDGSGNVIIRKPATPGMEDRKGVIMQGHLDMVHQKNAATDFDFDRQGIQSYVDGEWLKAKGTTLGSDNGVGVASIMAVLSSTEVQHGPFEGLFTIDEETGMTGAFKLEPGLLQGEILLNTDTEDEGELCIGCAGGVDTDVTWEFQPETTPANSKAFRLSVTGLKGGHSGCDIHIGHGNANKIMNRILWGLIEQKVRIASIEGGSLRNAIPRESFANLVIEETFEGELKSRISSLAHDISSELAIAEPDLLIQLEATSLPDHIIPQELHRSALNAIYAAPNGVYRMSDAVPGLVETSTNLSRVSFSIEDQGLAKVQFLTRSSVESSKDDLTNAIESGFRQAGAIVSHSGSYPGWEPNAKSDILDLMRDLYKDLYGKDAVVNAVHAGLECGIIGSVYPNLDMISFGPTIRNPHSPDEKCHIPSVEKYWNFLLAVLQKVPKQG